MPRRVASLLLAVALAGAAAPGADSPVDPVAEAASERAARRSEPGHVSWFALPVVFWLPETKLGYGATGGVHFHLDGAPRTSSLFAVGAYTVNGQGSADVAADLYLRGGVLLAGRVRAVHFPDAFYGLGPESATADRESFTRRFAEGVFSAELPVVPRRLRAGLRLDVRGEEIRDLEPGGQLASGTVEGADGFSALGVGASVTWDTRDQPLYPGRGSFLQAWYLHYPRAIGHHSEFSRANVEGRAFLPLGRERVLGVAAFVEQAFGDAPFTLLPKLGSTRFLRGWREGRFRDHVAWAAQAELRLPLAARIHGAAFGAFGGVGPDLAALRAEHLKVAGGVGLRYRLTPEGANVRLDVAVSDAGPEVYVLVLEAF